MTRSHKFNDKDHSMVAPVTGHTQQQVPKFFGKHGFADADPKKTKKNGGGKGNWGPVGLEAEDEEFNFVHTRRRSNSSSVSSHPEHFKSKFEINEPEPVFEEDIHGAMEEEEEKDSSQSSTSSSKPEDM
uniref:Uncharacterized protein n=2 Tax=Podospora anserina (strain S / ATCC MYA-4624 / DSM 980 / FGSC 10383) TaxID=515849 RepID=A0A090CEA0_PODAN|nr:Putative protein of unknown function [Podospora anserina S mat+]